MLADLTASSSSSSLPSTTSVSTHAQAPLAQRHDCSLSKTASCFPSLSTDTKSAPTSVAHRDDMSRVTTQTPPSASLIHPPSLSPDKPSVKRQEQCPPLSRSLVTSHHQLTLASNDAELLQKLRSPPDGACVQGRPPRRRARVE